MLKGVGKPNSYAMQFSYCESVLIGFSVPFYHLSLREEQSANNAKEYSYFCIWWDYYEHLPPNN